jgi:rhodanese-related sulfurtransferase
MRGVGRRKPPHTFFVPLTSLNMVSFPSEITVVETAATKREETVLLLDCREPEEYAIARIDRARLIPMGEIPLRLAELEPWRDKPIIVHCHHGVRSLRVARFLREKGFPQACSMRGGIEAWSVEIDPNVPRY